MQTNDILGVIKVITDDYSDKIYDNFLNHATTQDFRQVSDVDCNFCGGDGMFTDKEDWFDGVTTLQVDVPVICPCVEANEDEVVKYWGNKV